MDNIYCSKCGLEYNREKLKECPRCKHPERWYSYAELAQIEAEKKAKRAKDEK